MDSGSTIRTSIIVLLLEKFKGEQSATYHLAPMVAETNSGLSPKVWIAWLIEVREMAGHVHGPAFCDASRGIAWSLTYEEAIISPLVTIQDRSPEVISR